MGSFLKILHKIIVIGDAATPFIKVANPIIGQILDTVFKTILEVEGAPLKMDQSKKEQVMVTVIAHYAASGVTLDPQIVSTLIDNLVAALNDPKNADKRSN